MVSAFWSQKLNRYHKQKSVKDPWLSKIESVDFKEWKNDTCNRDILMRILAWVLTASAFVLSDLGDISKKLGVCSASLYRMGEYQLRLKLTGTIASGKGKGGRVVIL